MASQFSSSRGRKGDSNSLAQRAFREFRDGLYRYLLRKLRRAESAQDLTQEVYLRLLRTDDTVMVKNPQAYVFGIAFNVLYEFRLHEARNPVDFDSEAVTRAGEALPDAQIASQETYEARTRWLDEVMSRLSPMQRAVLLMAKRQGMPHADIASRLGISIGTVRKHLARAVDQCRRAAQETDDDN